MAHSPDDDEMVLFSMITRGHVIEEILPLAV
jgi:hypothetical protein